MTNESLISVIIPTYNRAVCIERAIKSVTNQSYQKVEIIVIDDGSTDKTQKILMPYIEKGIIIYERCEKNVGGASARNRGIDVAKGKYIAFLDSDDEWLKNKLTTQLQLLKTTKYPNNVIVYSPLLHYANNIVVPQHLISENENPMDYFFIREGMIQTSGLLMTRKLARDIRFKPIRIHQDFDFVLRAWHKKVTFISSKTPLYVMHDDQNMARVSRSFKPTDSLDWILENSADISKDVFQLYIKKYNIFNRILYHSGLMQVIKYLAKSVLYFKYFSISSFQIELKHYIYLKRIVYNISVSDNTRYVIYGAGEGYQLNRYKLVSLNIKIDCIVDKKLNGELSGGVPVLSPDSIVNMFKESTLIFLITALNIETAKSMVSSIETTFRNTSLKYVYLNTFHPYVN